MARTETTIRIFVGSPADVSEEREVLDSIVNELSRLWGPQLSLRLELERWETHVHPDFSNDPQDVVNSQLANDYDIFVGIFWGRVGTPTPRATSGSIEEFEQALERHRADPESIRIMIYFKEAPLSPSDIDPEQLKILQDFRKSLGPRGGLYWTYDSLSDFEATVRSHLSLVIQEYAKSERIHREPGAVANGAASLEDGDEYGFIDHLEQFEENNDTLVESLGKMSNGTVKIGEDITSGTEALREIGEIENKEQRGQAKRVLGRISDDLDRYALVLEHELPVFSKSGRSALDSLSRALVVYEDFEADDRETLEALADSVRDMQSAAQGCVEGLEGWKDTLTAIPRVTIQFNKSRRRVVRLLQSVLSELHATVETTGNIRSAIDRLLND